MATVTKTIGSDVSRDFDDILSWHDNGYGGALAGDTVIANMYNDSAFTDIPIMTDLTPDVFIIQPADDVEGHDGTAGTGVRWVQDTVGTVTGFSISSGTSGKTFTMTHWEYDANKNITTRVVDLDRTVATTCVHTRLIIHGLDDSAAISPKFGLNVNEAVLTNCILYHLKTQAGGGRDVYAISANRSSRNIELYNITIDNIVNDNGSGDCNAFRINDSGSILREVKNCVATGIGGTSSGITGVFTTTVTNWDNPPDTNATDNSTILGNNGITSITRANQYENTIEGFEIYFVQDTLADIYHGVNAGIDLGNTNNAHLDIKKRDRDAEGDTWDLGAHQFTVDIPDELLFHRRELAVP